VSECDLLSAPVDEVEVFEELEPMFETIPVVNFRKTSRSLIENGQ
jgi:hypothetical protein